MSKDEDKQLQIAELDDDQLQAAQGGLKSYLSNADTKALRKKESKTIEPVLKKIMAQGGDGSI